MMIKRFASYLCLALAACVGSFAAHAADRIEYIVAATYDIGLHGAASVKHELTLSQWRQGSQPGSDTPASNLIALSNHFGLSSAVPFGVPDWDNGSAA
jgi:hypothetical protein